MSGKSRFKLAALKKEPRTLEELTKIAQQLTFEIGNAQYQAFVFTQEAERLSVKLRQINQEGRDRQELDKKAAVSTPVEQSSEVVEE